MRVLQVIDSLNIGGAQRLLGVFAHEMLKRGHQITVISLSKPNVDSPIYKDLKELGVEVSWQPLRSIADLCGMHELTGKIKRYEPEIIHTQLNYANIHGSLAAWRIGIPVVASLHNASVHLHRYKPYRIQLETIALRKISERIVACGYTVARVQQHRFPGKELAVIPNPVPEQPAIPADQRNDVRNRYLPDGKGILVISVGRLIPEKGYPDLIRAIALVNQEYAGLVKMLIVGKGFLLEGLRQEVEQAGQQGAIELLGERNDVPQLLAASDIYLSGSHYEGQSLAVLEAMASGLPVVVTDAGDNRRVIADGCGLVLPPGKPELLAQALADLVKNPQERKRLGNNASMSVRKDFSAEKWVDQLLDLYSEVLHG